MIAGQLKVASGAARGRMDRQGDGATLGLWGWAMYDWANSAFVTVIQTFIFAAYFTGSIAPDPITGSALWGNVNSGAALLVAAGAPLLGAIADQSGRRKPWIFCFTIICVGCTALLWFIRPGESKVTAALILVGLATLGFEFAGVFYNAMLADLAPEERIGRWSGWGWGLGYAGGLGCLLVSLLAFIGDRAWFKLDQSQAAPVRATFVLVAVWYLLFSLPLFLLTTDRQPSGLSWRRAASRGGRQLYQSVREARRYRGIGRFLVARMIFADGLATLFVFGGIYAATVFGLREQEVLLFAISLNITAGAGAALFAWLDDRLGAKATILASLAGLLLASLLILTVTNVRWFWLGGLLLGIFVGPCQAAARSYLARLAPAAMRSEMFGLFALSGKATAFLGPLLVGWLTYWSGSQRIGMSVILLFLLGGFGLMLTVDNDRRYGAEEVGERI